MKLSLIAPFLLVASMGLPAVAQDKQPSFPRNFDESTVRRMIAEIDVGSNLAVLKVGYFLNRSRPAFPVLGGLQLLEASLKGESPGTKRWFILQWLRAFGTLRPGASQLDRAMVNYADIFRQANTGNHVSQPEVVRRIVNDFIFNVPSDIITGSDQDTEFTEIALVEAIKSHFRLGSPLRHVDGRVRPDLRAAVAAVASPEQVWITLIDRSVNDDRIPKNPGFYFSAEQIIRAADKSGSPHVLRLKLDLLAKGVALTKPGDPLRREIEKERVNLLEERNERGS